MSTFSLSAFFGGILLFIAKGVAYGLCLSFGFWAMGFATSYITYYLQAWVDGRFDEVPGSRRVDSTLTFRQQFHNEGFMRPFKSIFTFIERAQQSLKAA